MKVALLLTLSFFLPLFAFLTNLPLAFSDDDVEDVKDISGKPISEGGEYYIMPAIFGPDGGGVRIGQTGNSECPLTVLQAYAPYDKGFKVKFKILENEESSKIISTGAPLEIEFVEKPNCAKSSKWSLFLDDEIGKFCVGITREPDQEMLIGAFSIVNHGFGYKLVFLSAHSLFNSDIGRFDAQKKEGGNRLILDRYGEKPFEVVFVDASNFDEVGIIKSVV